MEHFQCTNAVLYTGKRFFRL